MKMATRALVPLLMSALASNVSAGTLDPVAAAEARAQCLRIKELAKRERCTDALLGQALTAWSLDWQQAKAAAEALAAKRQEDANAARAAAVQAEAKRIEPLLRAFAALEGSVDRGVTFNQYDALLHTAGTEAEMASRGSYGEPAKAAAPLFDKALVAYRDARRWWSTDIDFYSRRDNALAYYGGLPFGLVGLSDLVGKYDLPLFKADLLGIHRGVPRGLALGAMWNKARELRKVAEAALAEPVQPLAEATGKAAP